MPELSVIIPVYNRQQGVVRALASVLAQGGGDLEILVVDDGSLPPLSLPENYAADSRVRLLAHEINRGAAAARNTGLRAARGAWIAFLDSDDCWLPGTLKPRLAVARAAAAVGADPLFVRVAGFRYRRISPRLGDLRFPIAASNPLAFASGCWFSPGSTALFRREPLLARVGLQDERLRRFEDVDWFLRIALAGGGIVVDPIVAAEIEPSSRLPPAMVQQQGRLLLQNFVQTGEGRLGRRLQRRLRAWLAFEQASARWYAGDPWGMMLAWCWSWWLAPRPRFYLRKFWCRPAAP